MSEGKRMSQSVARMLAGGVISSVLPYCSRVELAGSLRRRSPDVGDIELVCIMRTEPDLFGEMHTYSVSFLSQAIAARFEIIKGGDRYIQVNIGPCKCDLFITTPDRWGVIFTIRTGPAYFSHKLVTSCSFGGYLPDEMAIDDGYLWKDGGKVPTPEEEDLFKAIGMEFIEPEKRM